MSTPSKNMKPSAPYDCAPGQQTTAYPSQSADYNSFHMGGETTANNSANYGRGHGRPPRGGFYAKHGENNMADNRNQSNFYSRNGNAGNQSNNNVPYFYQNRSQQDTRFNNQTKYFNNNFNNNRNYRGHQQRYPRHNLTRETADIRDYIHASMLEDPWHDLMERHLAIEATDLQLHIPQAALKRKLEGDAENEENSN